MKNGYCWSCNTQSEPPGQIGIQGWRANRDRLLAFNLFAGNVIMRLVMFKASPLLFKSFIV